MKTTVGYSGTPLNKKLGFKAGYRFAVINAPSGFASKLEPLPANCKVRKIAVRDLDIVILFCKTEKSLRLHLPKAVNSIKAIGMVWVAWPKKTSGVSCDLSFNVVQEFGLRLGLVDVKICAIDETWSGLKFVYRLKDRETLS